MMTPNQRSEPRSVTTDRCQALGAPRRHSSLGALMNRSLTQTNCAAGASVRRRSAGREHSTTPIDSPPPKQD